VPVAIVSRIRSCPEAIASRVGVAGLEVKPQVRDVINSCWPGNAFDVIVVSRFLCRNLCPAIQTALKAGGVLFYQTFVQNKVAAVAPSNPEYLLEENELLHLFQDLTLRAYREEGRCGDISKGWRNEAYMVGQKCVEELQ